MYASVFGGEWVWVCVNGSVGASVGIGVGQVWVSVCAQVCGLRLGCPIRVT